MFVKLSQHKTAANNGIDDLTHRIFSVTTAKQSGNEFSVNAVGMCNLPAGQIDVFGAGVYFQPAGMSRRSKRFCDGFFLYRRQFAYGKEIEQNLPALDERINTFQVLSEKIGRQRVVL